ncbi:hypothetical protein ACHAXS_011038 [Conticribra weissflogii]
MRGTHQQRRASLGSKLLSLRPKIGSGDASTTTESIVSSKYLGNKTAAANSQPCPNEIIVDRKLFAPKCNIRIFRKTSCDTDKSCRKPVVESDVETVDSTSASWGGDTHDGNEHSAGVTMANAFLQREQLRRPNSVGDRLGSPVSPIKKKVTFAEELDNSSMSKASPLVESPTSVTVNNDHSDVIPRSPRKPNIRDETKLVYAAEFESSKRCSPSTNVARPSPPRTKSNIGPNHKVNIPPPPFLQRKNTDNSNFDSHMLPPPPPQKKITSGNNQNANIPARQPPFMTARTAGIIPEFDKTYGRCVNHPSILIAVKAPFRNSGWSLIRHNCPLCDNELQNKETRNDEDNGKGNPGYLRDAKSQQVSKPRARVHGNITGLCTAAQAKDTALSSSRAPGSVTGRSFHDSQTNQISLSRARVHGNVKNQNHEGRPQRKQFRQPRGSIASDVEQGIASKPQPDHFGLVPYRSSMPSLCNDYLHLNTSHGGQHAQYHSVFFTPPSANENAPLNVCKDNANWNGSWSDLTLGSIDQRHNIMMSTRNQPLDYSRPNCNYPALSGHVQHGPTQCNAVVVNAMPWKSLMGAGKYTGDVNENGIPTGRGRIVFDNGNIYEGCWMDGNPQEIAETLALIEKNSA